ncbi:arsenic resistance protein [Marisediminicola sp. LYQ85]|uniref:arsenic resistance protein n=1 Tax=Marisediminicola sp. LYQ85 TaxID=3391062 RepID=UPI0039833357
MDGTRATEWLERRQLVLYLAALAVAVGAAIVVPEVAVLDAAVAPVLAVLLFVTFLQVPITRFGAALRDWRMLAALLALNFGAVPFVAFGLSRLVADDRALVFGVLLVLLAPCVDYVVAFTGLAGGSVDRLVAATPLLLVAQVLAVPPLLFAFTGTDIVRSIDPAAVAGVLVPVFLVPLALAWGVLAATRAGAAVGVVARTSALAMVPLVVLTLVVVVASGVATIGADAAIVVRAVPVFAAFAVVMVAVGLVWGRLGRFATADRRTLVMSGVTRNSLVVLPVAIALPEAFAVVPLVIVTQTLVEIVVLAVLVAVVPRIVR